MNKTVKLGNREVGAGHAPYIIAEACINHQGDPSMAREMVYVARAMGVDAIKFQYHVLDDEMLPIAPQSDNFDEPLYDTLEKTNLSLETHLELKELCEDIGIQYMCTPFSRASADILQDELDIPFFKTGSGELTNLPFQEHVAGFGKPVIVSTGMALVSEIDDTVTTVKTAGAPLILTHCVSAYPAPYNIVNLHCIPKYREKWGVPVGLSDHTIGIYTSLGAVALGAAVIEKHFTLNKRLPGPDHESSLEPYELGELVKGARAIWEASGDKRIIFEEEKQIIEWARESVVSLCAIPAGTVITEEMISVKRPSPGDGIIAARDYKKILGKTAGIDISADKQIKWSEIV